MMDSKIDRVLKKLEKQEADEQRNPTKVHHSEKLLSIGRATGLFYNIWLQSINAKKILEIGMSAGYSTMWFADAIKEKHGAKIISIEQDEKKIQRAKKNFVDTGLDHLIEIRKGDALEVLKDIRKKIGVKETFDFVFIDADKERYIQYFDLVFPMLKLGGLVGTDNILFPERFQKFSIPYLKHVRANPKIRSVTIPIDNGEEISVKI